ncbi:flagellar biosynthesis anti-sigma factor FlgM [Vogesella sp. LIG4]|uniref:flagellar biosynthesis anti-sigma factor FlgM n=1 Tax=Vogesella sp. LIG4 TaxID=1192162 RepID=UPI00081FC777|nr:flagellar biosynthesis anti-sigma factor FlgM [Vogesella sp. LIG4]SCK17566.1 anti-sigma-28 factor, FlgM family [Vogesella sp. LIG4]
MKISNSSGVPEVRDTTASQSGAANVTARPQAPAAAPAVAAPLQSAVLQPAKAALDAQPEIDAERVAEIKTALAEGKINFDAGKLAGLIRRYHGGRG